ncbi:putative TIR domain, P-loop containing nucleoside triphosphate hydrolase [Helianthus annuus]|nr:putative TIR domain, P-loop containing nucleoside triphosphate hydrolase [Helianthus annuus]
MEQKLENSTDNDISGRRQLISTFYLFLPLYIYSLLLVHQYLHTSFFPNSNHKRIHARYKSMASSSSSQSWIYDVFLSFRGEDTRKTYVDHLYNALVQNGIHTYKDDEALPRGETIGPALLKAIDESRIAVIIFSENYANSSWCLDEVTYIMERKDERGQIVMPIFYHVDPSEVRKQKGKYKEAFAQHELENNKRVEAWRKALKEAGNLAGWESKLVANGHESKGIKEIVNTISSRLFPVFNVNEDLIGIETRLQDLKSQLEIGSGGVRMVGIWGVGGGGKTTLASSAYSELSGKFDGSCFVENIREESIKYGLEKIQEKLLSGILKQIQVEVGRVEEGKHAIKNRLCHRKVLIVLDDVNHLDHLKALAGSHDWFGEGSRIIITTRDNHLLFAHKVNVIHNISLLNIEEGTELFCKHAPQDSRPSKEYKLLSKDVVFYARGLPLALKVLGSFLCDKDINEWRSALARLKKIPDTNIVEKLKISFDGLQAVEKELFLDIVCFFRGEKKDESMDIFDVCEFYPRIGLKVLVQKTLITINSDGRFDMHDLIQEMGHYIVRGEHPNNPETHTRVWQVEDVENICAMDATMVLDKIEAIRMFSDMDDPLPRDNHHVVANMKKLRWVDWRGHHASSLPTNFPPKSLRCLTLSNGQERQLWNGYKKLPNLRMIKLHGLKNLTMTPDFRGLPNLQRFMIYRCPLIEQIDQSIGNLEKLVFLLIAGCDNFKVPPSITKTTKLETLSLSKCSKLSKGEKQDTSYIHYFKSFVIKDVGLQFISTVLKKLILSNCHLGDEDIDWDDWNLPNLQELDLSWNKFSRLDFSRVQLPRLKWLDVSFCNCLVELLELPSDIAVLRADYCYALETVGDMSNCKWLWKVSFMGKNKLGTIGDQKIIDSLSQGNAIEHHFMSLALEHQVRQMSAPSQVSRSRFVMQLPHNWYNDFCGFLIHNVIDHQEPCVTIVIKQEISAGECNYQNELFQDPPPPPTYIGYVSFSSLRHTWLNSECNMISFYMGGKFEVKLVPRQSKGDHQVETKDEALDCSEFWDEEREDRKTFTVQHESKSSINILWRPC